MVKLTSDHIVCFHFGFDDNQRGGWEADEDNKCEQIQFYESFGFTESLPYICKDDDSPPPTPLVQVVNNRKEEPSKNKNNKSGQKLRAERIVYGYVQIDIEPMYLASEVAPEILALVARILL